MKATADESAELKQALKHDPETPELAREAEMHPMEADEAMHEVELGLDTAEPGTWVANRSSMTEAKNGDTTPEATGRTTESESEKHATQP